MAKLHCSIFLKCPKCGYIEDNYEITVEDWKIHIKGRVCRLPHTCKKCGHKFTIEE